MPTDYTEHFRELADYYNHSRNEKMTGFAAKFRAEFNRPGSWVQECAESLQRTLAKRRVLEVACGAGTWTETGDMVSLRHHDDGRPIEVVDTYFAEESVRELLAGKGRDLQIILKPWWWWVSYQVA